MALGRLAIKQGESVLEIGFGTGNCLKRMAQQVGNQGRVYGIDISPGMLKVAEKRLKQAGLLDRVELYCGDAAKLPYESNAFTKALMTFTLELFDTPEIAQVLAEVKRTLRPEGRLGVVSMSKSYGGTTLLRLYEWAHKKWPRYFDCRPIYVEKAIKDARYNILNREKVSVAGLPGEVIIAAKAS